MVDFNRLAQTAARLIAANGREVTFVKLNRDPANPAQPWLGNTNPPDPGEGGFLQPSIPVSFVPPTGSGFGRTANDDADPTIALGQEFEQIGLVAADAFPTGAPPFEEWDEIIDLDSSRWKVDDRWILAPSTTRVLYAVGLNR